MKRFLVFALALSLFLSLFSTGLAGKENNTFIYGIEGDPGNDVNTISTSGRYDLMTERMIYNPLYSYYGPDDLHYFGQGCPGVRRRPVHHRHPQGRCPLA